MPKRGLQLLCLLLFLLPNKMQGQSLPSLQVAKEISKGSLTCGLDYYLVTNSSQKGFADFALIRREHCDDEAERSILDSLPLWGERKPYKFFSEGGVAYGESGFIEHLPSATVYRFQNVPVYNKAKTDSTLYLMLNMARESDVPQALVVSGDINSSSYKEKLELLSMIVPPLQRPQVDTSYQWTPRDSMSLRVLYNQTSDVAAINAIFSSARLPHEYMNTYQPLVSKSYAYILGQIVNDRISEIFDSNSVPLADFNYRYQDSSMSAEDERFSFTLYTSSKHIGEATKLFASTLASLDNGGATLEEFERAKHKMFTEAEMGTLSKMTTNKDYVDKCVSSYLYGSNLASDDTINKFFASTALSRQEELPLFNSFVSALLDPSHNLTLRYDVPESSVDEAEVQTMFSGAWAQGDEFFTDYKPSYRDSLSFAFPEVKMRLRSETKEPVSGGELWTFSNGVRVVYKKLNTPGEFYYSLMLRSGVSDVEGLKPGEASFVGDMLEISNVASLSGEDFRKALLSHGITMNQQVTVSDLRISGKAPKENFNLLMNALLSLSYHRTPNAEAFAKYKQEESLRIDMDLLSPTNVNSLMDSVMHPDYLYSERKNFAALQDDLPQRAEAYFQKAFSKVNDGLIVLVGDLEEDELKKMLLPLVGNFQVQKKYAQRPHITTRYASGAVTFIKEARPGLVGGAELGVSFALSTPITFNLQSFLAFQIAVRVIDKELTAVLADHGAYMQTDNRVDLFPNERATAYFNCHLCKSDGLPQGVVVSDPLTLLSAVRYVKSKLPEIVVSKEDLAAYKNEIKGVQTFRQNTPDRLIDDVLVRYSEGKDLTTGFDSALNAVSAESVSQMLKQLCSGTEVEYVIL